MDFERIDINQCPPGLGNNGPNLFADTARCKKETTEVSFLFYIELQNLTATTLLKISKLGKKYE